jgi:hypothetical protein
MLQCDRNDANRTALLFNYIHKMCYKNVIKCYKNSKRKSFVFTVIGLLFLDKMNGVAQDAKVENQWNKAPEYHCVKLTDM